MGSRSAVCALAFITMALGACSSASSPSASQLVESTGPTPSAATSAGPISLDYNCNENKTCTFEAGSYVLAEANAPDGSLLPGLGFTLDGTWTSHELWLGSVQLDPADGGGSMAFLVDMLPATQDGAVAPGVANTASSIIASLSANPSLEVGEPVQTTLGAGLPAIAISLRVSPSWVNVDPDCPVQSCSVILTRPDWWCCAAIGLGDPTRIYVADIGKDIAHPHTLMIYLSSLEDAPHLSDAELAAFDQRVRPILDSLVVPSDLIIYCGDTHPAHRC